MQCSGDITHKIAELAMRTDAFDYAMGAILQYIDDGN